MVFLRFSSRVSSPILTASDLPLRDLFRGQPSDFRHTQSFKKKSWFKISLSGLFNIGDGAVW